MKLPPYRLALRHPAVRAALLLVLVGPVFVRWLGKEEAAPVRLRILGLAVAVVAAYTWDDRVHGLTAPTPVGVPAVRRGRALVVALLLALAMASGLVALPDGPSPVGAVLLQSGALAVLLSALSGWFGRDGESVLVLPLPALALVLGVLHQLPPRIGFFHTEPGQRGWPAEQARWWALLVVSAVVVAWWARDPASRRYRWRA